jgi:inositol transport system substrate-binding protein
VTQGVQGIVPIPNDVNALAPAANEVIAAKIPIVTVDRNVAGTTEAIAHVGADNVAGGVATAEHAIKKFPNGARIIFLRGEPGSSPAIDRAKGTLETLKAAGDKYKVLADQTANFKRDQGMTATQNLLTSIGTPPDVITCSNDDNDEVIKPFLVDKTNLDKAQRIGEAK